MKFFRNKREDKYTVIIGCGRLGSKLANTLSDKDENVLVIDKDVNSFKRLSSGFGGLNIRADGTDMNVLKETQVQNASAVIVATNNDNVNVMIAQMIKTLFKVENVIVRLFDPEKKSLVKDKGIDVICPAVLSTNQIDMFLNKNAG